MSSNPIASLHSLKVVFNSLIHPSGSLNSLEVAI